MRHRIFVPLANDSTSLQEVEATPAGDGRFRLVGSTPPGAKLRFQRGETVECEIQALPNGSKDLVAIRSISADPEFRKRRNLYAVFGAIVGGLLGATVALWFETTATAAALGFAFGAALFGFCSVRWGDDAWTMLSRIVGGRGNL